MQFQVFDSLPVLDDQWVGMDQTDNLVLDDQCLVSYLLDKFPRPLESGSCVSVPMEDLGQQLCLPVAGAFYNLAPGLWARAAPDRVVPSFAVVKEHGCLLLVHASMRKNTPAHICCAGARSRPLSPRACCWRAACTTSTTCVSLCPETCMRLRQLIRLLPKWWLMCQWPTVVGRSHCLPSVSTHTCLASSCAERLLHSEAVGGQAEAAGQPHLADVHVVRLWVPKRDNCI